jgi:hypothetical protein
MGARGPIAKRSSERLGKSMGANDTRNKVSTLEHDYNVIVPAPSEHWHDFAKWWYKSLRVSGQSKYYENSDWMTAFVAADLLDQMCEAGYSAGLLAEWNQITSRLLTCEADRRRVHVELVKMASDPDEDAADADVSGWKSTLAGEVVD